MNYKTCILFDYNGTLADSIQIIVSKFEKMFEYICLPYPGDDTIKGQIGLSLDVVLSNLLPKEITQSAKEFFLSISHLEISESKLFPDAIELLMYLKSQKKKIGLITSKQTGILKPLLERDHLYDYFDIVLSKDDVKTPKPNPEGILKAMEKLGTNKENTVYIGDSLHDMETANNAGVDFIAVTTGTNMAKDFEKHNVKYICKNLKEIEKMLG